MARFSLFNSIWVDHNATSLTFKILQYCKRKLQYQPFAYDLTVGHLDKIMYFFNRVGCLGALDDIYIHANVLQIDKARPSCCRFNIQLKFDIIT